jgi:hypothetical protein
MKKVPNRWLTVLAALLGLALSPVVFVLAVGPVGFLMPWLGRDISGLVGVLTALGPIVIGIAWSIFAAVEWKHGNIGIRIGLTAIVWTVVAAVATVLWGRCMLGG